MTEAVFKVRMSPYPHIGQLMRAADLCDGIIFSDCYTYFTVFWKDGEIVDNDRVEKARLNLKKAIKELHYDCYSIELVLISKLP